MVDEALKQMSSCFDEIYGDEGRRSIPPERLLRVSNEGGQTRVYAWERT